MRITFTLAFVLLSIFLAAQLQIQPPQNNPVVQRAFAKLDKERTEALERLVGRDDSGATARSHDCDNVDGQFTSGETLYVEAGDSLEICYNLEPYTAFNDISTNLDFGTSQIDTPCIKYVALQNVELGLTDTLRVEFCVDSAATDCFSFFFPLVVKRRGLNETFPLMTLAQEEIIDICVADIQLEGAIHETAISPCGESLLGAIYNGNFHDECFAYEASRFAEVDSVCFEICDEFCICDQYTYYFNTQGPQAEIPFMDDFSYPGPYPDKSKWLDDNVFINNTLAYQPPSVGAATFDGLDETGTPRGGGTGRSDFLTSNYFSLDGSYTDLWLSFWAENKGYAYPSNPGDSLILEFKNHLGDWKVQWTLDGENLTNDARPPFEFFKVKVQDSFVDTFLFDGFQFRFVNQGSRNNIQDTWHLDYVMLDSGEPFGNNNDMAFGTAPTDILKRYSSMPYWHFEGFAETELDDTIAYSIVNHFPNAFPVTDSEVSHLESTTGTDLLGIFEVEAVPTNIPGGERIDVLRQVPSISFDELVSSLNIGFTGSEYLEVDRTYTLESGGTQSATFEDVLRNDTVVGTTIFDNYFAYDDGTAEAVAALTSEGWEVAVHFHANVADTLQGVMFHFPHYGIPSTSAFFNIKVWVGSLDSEPVHEQDLELPYFLDVAYDSLQGFTTYRLEDFLNNATPVPIPAGDFYVGWQAASPIPVYVGLDYNTPGAAPYQFVNNNTGWFPLIDPGAFMIRPIVGQEAPHATSTADVSAPPTIAVYPNPARDHLYFKGAGGDLSEYDLRLYNASGQLLMQQILTSEITTSHLPQGLYFVHLTHRKSGTTQVERVVVGRR